MKSLLTLSSTYRKEEERNITQGKNVGTGVDFDAIYEVGEILGKGTTSIVRAVRRKDTGTIFACKYIDKYSVTAPRERLKDEIRVLTSARHPNLVSLHAVFETDRDLRLIVDCMQAINEKRGCQRNLRYPSCRLFLCVFSSASMYPSFRQVVCLSLSLSLSFFQGFQSSDQVHELTWYHRYSMYRKQLLSQEQVPYGILQLHRGRTGHLPQHEWTFQKHQEALLVSDPWLVLPFYLCC